MAMVANVEGIDITRLFAEFRNFGQTFITDRHLKGRSDVRLTLSAALRPSLALDQNSLRCVAGIVITDGQLNDHGPMIAVADHVRDNKLVAPFVDTDELKRRLTHVTFARLENQIEIKDRTVFVPQMVVRSSAMDIEVSGAQTFDGGVDDHLNFRLGDLFRMGTAQEDEFGPVADDGTGLRIFLHMYGTTDDLRFGNDGAAAAARRKQRIKQESATLKTLLADAWRGGGAANATVPANTPLITVEAPETPVEDPAMQPVKRRKGLGRLLEKEEEGGKDTIILE